MGVKGWMRMGIVAQRRRKRRAAQLQKSLLGAVGIACVLALLACSPPILERIRGLAQDVQAFSHSAQLDMTLPEYDVYALQLAVFDNGERAANELRRLQARGVRGVIWQKERMRIVADAALSREALDVSAAKGEEAYVISDTLEAVSLRLNADAAGIEQVKTLLETPDRVLKTLALGTESVFAAVAETRTLAQEASTAHPENELYTQLAQSLLGWCDLMEKTLDESDEAAAGNYGAATMCLLCRELRQALSMLSTASAQRTPSTAADVMPPA